MSMSTEAPSKSRRLRWSALVVAVTAGALLAGNASQAEAAPPDVISRWNNELVHANSLSPGFNMFLATGPYTVNAKLNAANQGGSAIAYTCVLSAAGGADTDVATVTLAPNSTQTVFLTLVHNYTSTGQLTFGCTKPVGTSTVLMKQVKITAIKVNTLDNQAF